MIRSCIGATMILATLVSPGCVRSRDIVLHVSDIDSGEPIESARVTVTRSGVGTFAKFGAGSVAHFQEGFTDQHGNWRGMGADGVGSFSVSAPGYGFAFVGLGLDWQWPEHIQIGFRRMLRPEVGSGGASP